MTLPWALGNYNVASQSYKLRSGLMKASGFVMFVENPSASNAEEKSLDRMKTFDRLPVCLSVCLSAHLPLH